MPIENTARPPIHHASVVVGVGADVAPGAAIDLRPLSTNGSAGAIWVRWMGAGIATLWYNPLSERLAYTASEQAAGVPKNLANVGSFLPLTFASQYEAQFLQASHIHGDSTAGTWLVGF
jgi:hypothetical protein